MLKNEIETIARLSGEDILTTFQDLLRYTIHFFDPTGKPLADWRYKERKNADGINMAFYNAMSVLTKEYSHGISTRGWCDPLGDTFMELQPKFSTGRFGQFFTPLDVSELTAKITAYGVPSKKTHIDSFFGDRVVVSDPTCGSGRNLLAFGSRYIDKPISDTPYFVGEDIDATCCMMCALNLMFHGFVGEVVCHDTLGEPDKCRFGYVINETLCPFPSALPSIRYTTDSTLFFTLRSRR